VEVGRRIQENLGEGNVRKVVKNVVKRKMGEGKRNLVKIVREKDQEEELKRKATEASQRDKERIVSDKQMTLPVCQTLP